jgi:hypothetical protein
MLEGTEQAIICKEMKPDPLMKDHIVLRGMAGLTIQGSLQVEELSVRTEDIKYYATVNPLQVPMEAKPVADSTNAATPSNGGEAPPVEPKTEEKRKPGRPPKKTTPQA